MTLYLGVDWSVTELVCAAALEQGPLHKLPPAKPTLSSVQQVLQTARTRLGAPDAELFVMIEAGSPLWVSLLYAAGATVFVCDPKQAKRYAESRSSSYAKDDARDAAFLLDMLRSPAHRGASYTPDADHLAQLDLLAATHESLTTDLGRVKQRLRERLRQQMPVLEQALPKELCARGVDTFLRTVPTPLHAASLTRQALDPLMPGARKKTRDAVWQALQQTQAPWLTAPVADTLSVVIITLLDQMKLLSSQLSAIETQMDTLTRELAERKRIASMPGIALLLSATLMQYAWRNTQASDRDSASIVMGASPVFIGSARRKDGKKKGKVLLRRAAPAKARRACYLIGRLASQHIGWAKAMFQDARKRQQSAATAYRRIARCVLRIQTAMAKSGQPYDDDRYVAALKSKGVSWAMAL
jgi:hypothetical protein